MVVQKWLNLGWTARERTLFPLTQSVFFRYHWFLHSWIFYRSFKKDIFLFLKKIKFGHFMRVLKFSDKILGQILVKNQGLRGVRGGKKKCIFFLHFDPKCMCTKNEVSRSKNEEVSLCWVYPPLNGNPNSPYNLILHVGIVTVAVVLFTSPLS